MGMRLNSFVAKIFTLFTYDRLAAPATDPPDWIAYGACFLGRDAERGANSVEAWAYQIADNGKLSLPMLHDTIIAARTAGDTEIVVEAERLLCEHGYLAMSQTGDTAELLVYGDIGGWDEESVHAAQVTRELKDSNASEIHVRINSYGGSVTDGLAIYNALRRHPAHVTSHIDGVAASIASLIAAAGDSVEAATTSMMMVHAPWTVAMGNAKDLRETADVLDVFSSAMAAAYTKRLGKQTAKGMLTDGKDHWFTADEAVKVGLADTLTAPNKASSAIVVAGARARYGEPTTLRIAAAGRDDTGDGKMVTKVTLPDPGDNVVQLEEAARAQVLKVLKERNALVAKTVAPFLDVQCVRAKYEAFIVDPEANAEDFNREVLAELGRGTKPVTSVDVGAGEDASDKFRKGAMAAVLARAGLETDDPSNELRGSSLLDLGREALAVRNVRVRGKDKMSIVAEAFTHTSSDFPQLLADIARKTVLKGWSEQAETFPSWTATGTLPDFKILQRVDLNLFPSLIEVPEGGEYKYGTIGEHGESVQLATYGRLFSITRKAIINDDLHEFTRIPQRMGRSAKRTIGNLVYAILTGNPNLADGVALFAAGHSNLLAAGAISTTSVDEARVAMQTQKDPDGFATLNIRPKFLLVPAALEGTARTVMTSQVQVPVTGRNYTVPNSVANLAEVISEARLDTASAVTWYMVADPSAVDTIEVDYLDGQSQPYLEQQNGWEVDGVAFKVRIDAGVKALDFRGIVKNPGA